MSERITLAELVELLLERVDMSERITLTELVELLEEAFLSGWAYGYNGGPGIGATCNQIAEEFFDRKDGLSE